MGKAKVRLICLPTVWLFFDAQPQSFFQGLSVFSSQLLPLSSRSACCLPSEEQRDARHLALGLSLPLQPPRMSQPCSLGNSSTSPWVQAWGKCKFFLNLRAFSFPFSGLVQELRCIQNMSLLSLRYPILPWQIHLWVCEAQCYSQHQHQQNTLGFFCVIIVPILITVSTRDICQAPVWVVFLGVEDEVTGLLKMYYKGIFFSQAFFFYHLLNYLINIHYRPTELTIQWWNRPSPPQMFIVALFTTAKIGNKSNVLQWIDKM